MKVCMATRCFDFRNAGIGRVSSEIMAGVKDKGHEIHPVATEGSMSLYQYYYYVTWGIRKKLPTNCDVYHALTPMEALWTPKRKTIVTFHDLFLLTDPDRVGGGFGYNELKRDIGRKFFKDVCRVAATSHTIVCVSEKTKEEVLAYFKMPESKVRVIRSGIKENLQPQHREPNGVFRIGYLGGLDRRKRVNLLIEAFKTTRGNMELVIGGTGLDEQMLKELAKGDSRIKFLGLVQDEALCDFFTSLDMFCFPTAVEGYGLPCLLPEEKIMSIDGLKEIKEIRQGDLVLTHKGMFRPVLKTLSRHIDETLVEIRIWGDNTPIRLTENHPVYAFKRPRIKYRRGRMWHVQIPEWIPAAEIKKGDCVIFPSAEDIPLLPPPQLDLRVFDNNVLCNENQVFYKMGYSSITKEIVKVNRYIKLNKKFARLLGYYIAEGSIDKSNNSVVEFSFGIEPHLVSDTCWLLKTIFNVNPRTFQQRTKTRILVSSQILNKLFSSLCGKGASHKYIPPLFLYGNTDVLKELLHGIWLGDGNKSKNAVFFSTASEKLAYDLKTALIRIGLKPTVKKSPRVRTYKGIEKHTTEYTVGYSTTNINNCAHSNKSWYMNNTGHLASLVKQVKYIRYSGQVHNLEVHKDNSYVTRCFSVHNCVEAMACKIPTVVLSDSLMPHEVKSRCIEVSSPSQLVIPWELPQDKLDENYQFAKSHDWNRCVDEYIELYKEIADEK